MSSYKLKVILRRTSVSGKKSLIKEIIKNRFEANYKRTVGVEILTKDVEFKHGERATLSIWDIGNQRRFDFFRNKFYRGAVGAILIFDLTQEKTYNEILKWFNEIKENIGFIPFLIIGTNVESIKEKDKTFFGEKAREFARINGGNYVEIPPNNISVIEDVIRDLTRKIIEMHFSN